MTMRKVDPKALGDFVLKLLESGPYRRLIRDRYFRAKIASVTGAGPYMCTLIRTGEPVADGGSYLCATPGYVPVVGHDVLCTWVDAATAIVLWKVA